MRNLVKLFVLLSLTSMTAPAQGRDWAELPLQLRASQVCYLEGGWSEADCAAVLGVLRRRAGGDAAAFAQQLQSYSAILSGTARAARVRTFTTDGAQLKGGERLKWLALQLTVIEVLAGSQESPCPLADHWGAGNVAIDVENALRAVAAGKWRVAKCSTRTGNIFYEISATANPARVAARLRLLRARVSQGQVSALVASGSYPDRNLDHAPSPPPPSSSRR